MSLVHAPKQVYLASASPPVRYANVYGVDMPTRREFVAAGKSEEEIRLELGADGLLYQSIDDLIDTGRALNPAIREFDASCFTGARLPACANPFAIVEWTQPPRERSAMSLQPGKACAGSREKPVSMQVAIHAGI